MATKTASKEFNRETLNLNNASIGPSSWRNETLKEINFSQNAVYRSDKSLELGRSLDPLPHIRDILAELSNDEAHSYFRQTRAVVAMLRESFLETNEEIKALNRGKEALEKALEHKRKDLSLNRESSQTRLSRPKREKDHDGVDDLLQAERMHLLNLKKMLENQLQSVQQQLQVLDQTRSRLAACTQERSRVLDLICHALSAAGNNLGMQRSKTLPSFTNHTRTENMRRPATSDGEQMDLLIPDPLGPYTPEVDLALQEAKDARGRSSQLRQELSARIMQTQNLQRAALQSVNSGLTQKIAETVSLKQQLQVAHGENRHGLHRAQRWYNTTDKARGYALGPVSTSDLITREKLQRPIFKIYQRHPGTQVPEAQEVIKAGNGLLESLTATSRNIGMLRLAQLRLREDTRDKKAAIDVDGAIVRLRRRKANHRWIMGEAF